MEFFIGEALKLEESLVCEFKEVKGVPIQTISKTIDEYVVAFLNVSGGSMIGGTPPNLNQI